MLVLHTYLRTSWGWSVRSAGTSAGGPSLPLPPPSTVIGAVARSLAELKGWPETEYRERGVGTLSTAYRLARLTLGAGVGLVRGFAVTASDMIKHLNVPYLRSDNREDEKQWFGAMAFGVVVSPGSELCVALVLRDDAADALNVSLAELEASVCSVNALGCKEGIVEVLECGVHRTHLGRADRSGMYVPEQFVDHRRASWLGLRLERLFAWDFRSHLAYGRVRAARTGVEAPEPRVYAFATEGHVPGVIVGHEGRDGVLTPLVLGSPTVPLPADNPCRSLVLTYLE